MATTPTSFRLTTDTLVRLRSLARSGESLASVVARAAVALEAAPIPPPADDTTARLVALEDRMALLEKERSTPVARPVARAVEQHLAGAPGLSLYPLPVRQMAVRLNHEGVSRREIRTAVAEANGGMAPHPRNWAKTLSGWVKALA